MRHPTEITDQPLPKLPQWTRVELSFFERLRRAWKAAAQEFSIKEYSFQDLRDVDFNAWMSRAR